MIMKTVVIIEDHIMIRAGLSAQLEGRWHIAGETASLKETEALFTRLEKAPDLVLLDIELGKDWGLDILNAKFFKSLFRNFRPVLVYSVYDDYAHVNAALRSGARGYICKSQGVDELLEAMNDVASGKSAFPPSLIQRLANVSDMVLGLSKREQEVFSLVQQGLDNKEIAATMGVSVRTIENNLSIIYDKTGVKNRRDLEKM